jgi:hypothetical protein
MKPVPVIDPVEFTRMGWPDITLYREQKQIMYSVMENDETVVTAGHQLGKDFISGLIVLWWLCSRRPARVVTTSVKFDQLDHVLWGEIRNFINSCKINLPVDVNHMELRQVDNKGNLQPKCEVTAQVARQGESLAGYHLPRTGGIPRTLAVFDESSGIPDSTYKSCDTWAHRILIIGNPYSCKNFFYKGVKAGDLPDPGNPGRFYRKVMKIKAEDSPNVRYALAEIAAGKPVSNTELIPGVKSYRDYIKHRQTWDKIKQCVGLDAEFYDGEEQDMFPATWLNASESQAMLLPYPRKGEAMGVDTAEGGDSTCWTIIDRYGVIDLISEKTADTNVIPSKTLALMHQYGVPAGMVNFDRGGGGKQHADVLRAKGYPVKTTAFGSKSKEEISRRVKTIHERREMDELRYSYRNRRAQMYHELAIALDINRHAKPFAIPARFEAFRDQLKHFPLQYDGEGVIWLPPKNKPDPTSNKESLVDIIGHSPDEADSLVLAYHQLKWAGRGQAQVKVAF